MDALRKAAPAPKPVAVKAAKANNAGKAKAKEVTAVNDGFLRVTASARDTGVLLMISLPEGVVPQTPIIVHPFRGAPWNLAAVAGSKMVCRGAHDFAQTEPATGKRLTLIGSKNCLPT